jgi:competence protein ComEC
MLLGTRSHIDFETMQTYASLGAIHILSVSGMHVGLLYIGLSFIFGFLLKRGRSGSWVFFFIMMISLWLYAGISGFSAPVLRSAWMFSLMLFSRSFGFQRNTINLLAFSCFVLLVYDPNQLFQSGFQLSYLAVLGLLIYQHRFSNWVKITIHQPCIRIFVQQIWDLNTVALAAQVLTLPLVIYYFHQIPHPFYFFLLNPLLIFLSSISLGLGLLFVASAELLVFLHFDLLYFGLGYLLDKGFDVLHALMFFVVNGVHPVISFLQIEVWEIVCLIIILIVFEIWLVYRRSFFLYFNSFILLLIVLYHNLWIPYQIDKQQILYFSHYKKDLVLIQIQREHATIIGSKELFLDGSWLQAHISPLCAYHHILDTSNVELPAKLNVSWEMQGKKIFFMQSASEKLNNQVADMLFLGSEIKWKNPYWMKSWKGTTWYFVQTPSPFYRKKWELDFRKYSNSVASLDTLRF